MDQLPRIQLRQWSNLNRETGGLIGAAVNLTAFVPQGIGIRGGDRASRRYGVLYHSRSAADLAPASNRFHLAPTD